MHSLLRLSIGSILIAALFTVTGAVSIAKASERMAIVGFGAALVYVAAWLLSYRYFRKRTR